MTECKRGPYSELCFKNVIHPFEQGIFQNNCPDGEMILSGLFFDVRIE